MPIPAIVSAVAPAIAGAAVQGLFGQASANTSMAFSKEVAQNAHQWEVADLKKAGLNPIISALGKGASASGGAQARIDNPAIAYNQAKLVGAQTGLIEQQTRKTQYDADVGQIAAELHQWALKLGKTVAQLTPADLFKFYSNNFGNSAKDDAAAAQSLLPYTGGKSAPGTSKPKSKVKRVPESFWTEKRKRKSRKENRLPRKRHPLEGSRHPY